MKKFLLSAFLVSQIVCMSFANEYTLKFDGDNDMYGLTRQNTTDVNALQFVPEFSFTEAGIDFKIENTATNDNGFALVNDGNKNAGLLVYSGFSSSTNIDPKVTLTVPGGKIKAVRLCMNGSMNNAALTSLSINFNNAEIESSKDGDLYYWNWKNEEGVESVSFSWENKYYSRYIRTISLTYTEDLGDKQECGLSFDETSATGFLGESFVAPVLNNPHGLPVTWSSSSEEVATVDVNGTVTFVAPGKTVITVATVGNSEYAAGSVSYELQVIPVASDIPQLLEFAPEVYDKVKVNFPMTVTFGYTSFAFVLDKEGNAGYVFDTRNNNSTSTNPTTIYKVGNVIPAGWVATNATVSSNLIWEGLPDKSVETVEVVYPEVEAVTPADVNRVVILKHVTFETSTPDVNTKDYGTTPDGTRYEFQNNFNALSKPAGTYNVTCAVRYTKVGDKEYFFLTPIDYEPSAPVMVGGIEDNAADVRYFDLRGVEVSRPCDNIYIRVANGKATKVIIK